MAWRAARPDRRSKALALASQVSARARPRAMSQASSPSIRHQAADGRADDHESGRAQQVAPPAAGSGRAECKQAAAAHCRGGSDLLSAPLAIADGRRAPPSSLANFARPASWRAGESASRSAIDCICLALFYSNKPARKPKRNATIHQFKSAARVHRTPLWRARPPPSGRATRGRPGHANNDSSSGLPPFAAALVT